MVRTEEYSIDYSANVVIALDEKIHVLHVDDDPAFLKTAKQCLEMDPQLQLETALSVDEALAKLQKDRYDVVISDYLMPERDGLELLRQLREVGTMFPSSCSLGKAEKKSQ